MDFFSTSGISLNNIILIILVSFLISFFLYFFKEKEKNKGISKKIIFCMFFLRFLSLSIIFLLILNPFFKKQKKIIENQLIVFFQDNSSSLISNNDSIFYKNEYKEIIDSLVKSFSTEIEVDFLLFGDEVREGKLNFEDKSTNISDVLNYAENIYSDNNILSFVILSDGIYNQGLNPIYSSYNLNAPINCLALGDTSIIKDLSILSINNNELGFPGNDLPVEVIIKADYLKGEKIKIISSNSKKIFFEDYLLIDDNNFVKSVKFYVSSNKEGLNQFDVQLKLLSDTIDEKNINNNLGTFYINLSEKKKNILVLYSCPHPDISSIVNSIKKDEEYNVNSMSVMNFSDEEFTDFDPDLLILHQIPDDNRLSFNIFKYNLPIWYINGPNTDFDLINDFELGLQFNNSLSYNSFKEVLAESNLSFKKFTLSNLINEMIKSSPPLLNSNKSITFTSPVHVLINEKSKISQDFPLMFFGTQDNNEKYAMLNGEGIWRWKLFNYLNNKNHNLFDEFIFKIVKNLLINDNQDRFRLNFPSVSFYGESLIFSSELYDENLEKSFEGNIDFVLKKDGNSYNYKFTCIEKDYFLDLGVLDPGEYEFEVVANLGDYFFAPKRGSFLVKPVFFEEQILTADHKLLFNISENFAGNTYKLNQINELSKYLNKLKNNQKNDKYEYSYTSIFDFFLFLLIILFLLFLEWILRKKYFSY